MKPIFASMLNQMRREKGLSQRQAAQELGVSQALLSHYENGVREPKLEFVVRACEYYGVSADYALGRTEAKGAGGRAFIPARTEAGQALAERLDAIIARLESLGDDGLRAACARYISLCADTVLAALSDPDRPYNPLADVEKKRAEAAMLEDARNIVRGEYE